MLDVIHTQTYISDADGVFTRYVRPLAPTGCKVVLEAASLLPHATSTAGGTDYDEVVLKQGSTAISLLTGTNSGQAADATHQAGATLTAGTEKAMTLTGVGSQLEFSATVPLVCVGTKGGDGVALEVDLICRWRIMRSAS